MSKRQTIQSISTWNENLNKVCTCKHERVDKEWIILQELCNTQKWYIKDRALIFSHEFIT